MRTNVFVFVAAASTSAVPRGRRGRLLLFAKTSRSRNATQTATSPRTMSKILSFRLALKISAEHHAAAAREEPEPSNLDERIRLAPPGSGTRAAFALLQRRRGRKLSSCDPCFASSTDAPILRHVAPRGRTLRRQKKSRGTQPASNGQPTTLPEQCCHPNASTRQPPTSPWK